MPPTASPPPPPAGPLHLRRPVRSLLVAALLAGAALVHVPAGAEGQIRGVYLPLDHPAHGVAELLVARGTLQGLDGASRPFLLRELRASVAAALQASGGDADATLAWLGGFLGGRLPEGDWGLSLELDVGMEVASSLNPELLLAAGDSAPADLQGIRAGLEYGPVAVQVDPWRRARGRHLDVQIGVGRAEWRWGWVEWGQVDRNWGPPGVTGILVAPLRRNRAELSFGLGPPVLRFEYRSAALSNGISSETGEPVARWWAMHRLRWRPTSGLELALWETTLSAEEVGPDAARRSPFAPFSLFGQQGRSDDRNVIVGLDASWRIRPPLLLETQLVLDDFVKLGDDDNPFPHRLGGTLQLRGPLRRRAAWRVYGTALSALALNTFDPAEAYLDDGEGLGRLRPDHVELGALLSLGVGFDPEAPGRPLAGVGWPGQGIVEAGLRWRRQGVRRFTDPFPDPEPGSAGIPTFSSELEREVWALVTRADWSAGPVVLRGEAQLQRRRYPASGAESDWGLEGALTLLWRIGPWGWTRPESGG